MRFIASAAIITFLLFCGSAIAQPKRPPARPGKMGPPPNGMIERLNRMTLEQRQRALDRLPPERREKVERRLENFNALPPEEKDRLREQYQAFQKLPPEKQDAIRRSFREFNQLPEDRRPLVRRELMYLRGLSGDERATRFGSDAFKSRYSDTEQQLLQDLANSPGPARDR
jgi:hypothetical protein